MKKRYRTHLCILIAAAAAAASSILPCLSMNAAAEEDFIIVEEGGRSAFQTEGIFTPQEDSLAYSPASDGEDLVSGSQTEEGGASPFDIEEGLQPADTPETEAETAPEEAGTEAAGTEETEPEAAVNEETELEAAGTEETESEMPEILEEAAETASVYIKVSPEQANSRFILYCAFYLRKAGEEDWTCLEAGSDGRLYRAGEECAIGGLEYGEDYRIRVSAPHYSDSREYGIRISEDGTVYIDGSQTDHLEIPLSVARYMDRSDLTKIELTGLNKIPRSAALEGGTATKSFLLSAFLAGTNAYNKLVLLSLSDYSLIRTESAKYALEHANDMTYIESEDRIYVMPMDYTNRVIFLNGTTLAYEGERVLGQNYHAVAWDEASGCFFCVYEGPRGIICDVLNTDMTRVIRSFPIHTNLTYQGAAAYNSMLYYTCWERGGVSSYQAVYDGVLKANDNVIYVYDIYGNLCKTYYIEGGSSKSELETLSFVNGRMILQFNERSDAAYYRVDPIPAAVNLSVSVTQNGRPAPDGAYSAVLKRNGKQERELSCRGGAFTASSVSITEPGSYTFTICPKSGSQADRYVYDTAQVSFTVTAVYDPYTNALTTEVSGPSRPAVTNTKLSDAQRRKIRELKKQRVSLSRAKGKTSALKLRWKKVRFGKGKVSGYMVQICRNRKFRGSSLQTVSTTSTSLTVRNLTAEKNYYVRIRAYRKVGVKTFCSKWSEKRKVRIPGR